MIQVLYVAGAISLLLSLLALLAARYLRHAIVAPIRQLATGGDAIASGNLTHRVAIRSGDECSELANDFNHMVSELQGFMVSKTQHEEQASQLRALLDGVHDYTIFSMDKRGFVTDWNAASTRKLRYGAEDMEGVSFARIFQGTEQARTPLEEALGAIATTGRFESDTHIVHKNGEAFDVNIVVTPGTSSASGTRGYTVVVRDITERIKAERHIEQLATKDALTPLSNRNLLMDQLSASIARAARAGTQIAVMFIDLDHFKTVSDTLGHAAGDELLRECGKRLSDCVREVDIVAHLGGDEFVLHYQLQVSVASGEIHGVESLIRWQHPTRGWLSPARFVEAAEQSGLIVTIGDWILDHACHTIKGWRGKGVNIPHVSVNVSAAQLNEGLVVSVPQALVNHGIEPSWLVLEITETMLMEEVDEAIAMLRCIRNLGIRIAMDDFGTGYSSLSVLQRLPLDALKIDRSFVSTIDQADNASAVAMIGAMIAIAKEHNLSAVAEGVESPTQLAFLRTLNCDTYQGYLYSCTM